MADPFPEKFGKYKIIEEAGRGGFADVYKAIDTTLDRTVALKFLEPRLLREPAFVESFQREAKLAANLKHPNIVIIHEFGWDTGMAYMAMEFLEGRTLKEVILQEGALPPTRIVNMAGQMASALDYAHGRGLVHRDIKPSNIMVGADDHVTVMDFGIAKAATITALTTTGKIFGTPEYMSPEQAEGVEEPDARSDVYSLGVVVYQMFTGKVPFSGTTPLSILRGHADKPPPWPSEINPAVSPAVEAVLLKALAKRREARYQSAGEMAAALKQAVQAAPVEAPAAAPSWLKQPTIRPRPPAPVPAWRRWLAAAGLVLLVLAGIVLSGVLPRAIEVTRPPPPTDVALVTPTATSEPTATPTATPAPTPTPVPTVEPVAPDEYMVLVAQLEPLGVEERDVTRFIVDDLVQTLEVGVPFSKLRIREYPVMVTSEEAALAAAEANGATVMVWGNYTPDFIELEVQLGVTEAFPSMQMPRETLERSVNVRVRMTDERRQSVVQQVLLVLAGLQMADGDAYEMMSTVAIRDEIEVASAEVVGGGVAAYVHRYFEAYVHDTPRAIEEIEAALALDPGNPFLYADRGAARQRLGLFDDGRRDAQTALRLGPDQWAGPLYLLGNDAFFLGDLDEAISYYSRVVDLRPEDWFAVNYRGALHYLKGEYDLAKADYERSFALGPKANFPYAFSAMIALREGRMADAAALMKTVLTKFPDPAFGNRIILAVYGDEVPIIFGPTFSAFGNLILGQYDRVVRDTEVALTINDQLVDLYFMQGFAYCNLKEYAAAEAAYTRGLETDPDFIVLYLLRAEVRAKQNNLGGAFEDVGTAQASELGDALAEVIAASQSGALSCENFFSYGQ
jgi:serine/threonine protein kinase/tetratricopeptide (TPR) repeat protein